MGFHPIPHQGIESPGPHTCGISLLPQTNSFPPLPGENGQESCFLLLARRLKAANPDAAHPGKAGE